MRWRTQIRPFPSFCSISRRPDGWRCRDYATVSVRANPPYQTCSKVTNPRQPNSPPTSNQQNMPKHQNSMLLRNSGARRSIPKKLRWRGVLLLCRCLDMTIARLHLRADRVSGQAMPKGSQVDRPCNASRGFLSSWMRRDINPG